MRFYVDSKLGVIGLMTLSARVELLNGLTDALLQVREGAWIGEFDGGKTLVIEYQEITEADNERPREMGWSIRAGTREKVDVSVLVREDGTLVGYLSPPDRIGTPIEVAECIADHQLATLAVKFKVYAPEIAYGS